MTSQREVVDAFVAGDDGPWRASNFRMVTVGARKYLIGGRNGCEIVIAKREPINQVTVYANSVEAVRKTSLGNGAGRRQVRVVERRVRLLAGGEHDDVSLDRDRTALPVPEDIPALQEADRL